MIRPRDVALATEIRLALARYERALGTLPGLSPAGSRETLVEQLIESDRRNRFIASILEKDHEAAVWDPLHDYFDPLKAAVMYNRQGQFEEACWLVFLSVHFGKNGFSGWRLARDIYGKLQQGRWTWNDVSSDINAFIDWLGRSMAVLRGGDGIKRNFGNHRKYQSLHHLSATGTGMAVASYVDWIAAVGSHRNLFEEAIVAAGNNPREAFLLLFTSMSQVVSFGRTAKFDYLTMIGKLDLADIEPGSAFLVGATGPFRGAKLLFDGSMHSRSSQRTMDRKIITLESYLGLGMQAMEDALCNWQKSPHKFIAYRG